MTTPISRRSASGSPLPTRVLRSLLSALVVLCLCGAAVAQEKPGTSFRERYDQAAILFKASQFDEAIEAFQALYDTKPVPILLFNIAQAHRRAGRLGESLPFYHRFLAENPKADLKSEAEGYVKEITQTLEQRERAAKQAEEERLAKEEAQQRADSLAAGAKEPPPRGFTRDGAVVAPTRPFRVLKWVAAGVGVLALGAGVALLALDGRPTCELATGQTLCPQQLATLPAGAALVAGGAVALGASAAFFVVDYKRSREGQQALALALHYRF